MSASEFDGSVSTVCQFTVKENSWTYIKHSDFIGITGVFLDGRNYECKIDFKGL
jgi:exo-beta-1,3-glucanase (GH17 family)